MTASTTFQFDVRQATGDDLERVLKILREADLPDEQVADIIEDFIVVERQGRVVACGALELYGGCGLVRSVAVEPSEQGKGLGRVVAEALEARASEAGALELYLFTIDAWRFWQLLGYEEATLEDWPEAPRASWQYRYVSAHRERFRAMGLRTMRKLRSRL